MAVVAAIVAIVMAGSGQGGIVEPAALVSVTGPSLPELTDPMADPAVGQALPTLSGVDLNGQPISIGPNDGPMAIVVLAHWCAHCQAELPEIVRFIEQGRVPAGMSVVGLSTAIDAVRPNYPPSAWFEREAWRQPTLIDDTESLALGALGLRSFPGFVFVDGGGRVTLRLTGEIGAQQFGNALDSLRP